MKLKLSDKLSTDALAAMSAMLDLARMNIHELDIDRHPNALGKPAKLGMMELVNEGFVEVVED